MTTTTAETVTPVFPLSMFDPVHLGMDENGEHVYVDLAERNMLLGGEPGGGKSNALNLIVAHGALSADCKLILVDGKQVELGPWRHCADQFIGPSIEDAITAFTEFQTVMNDRYRTLLARRQAEDHQGWRRGRLPRRDRRVRLLLGHRRVASRSGRSSACSPATWSPAAAPPA